MAITLRYFTEFGKPVFQLHRSVPWLIYCIVRVYDVVIKKVHVRYLIS